MFYLLILFLQMKLLRQINDLNKAIKRNEMLGFVPTMGGLHKGHENLIKISKKRCKKTIVSIFVNPTQFNDKDDYKKYPKSLNQDLKILKKLKVDYVYLPTTNQIYNKVRSPKIFLKKREKILCAKYRKGHFEGVLDVMNRFVKLLSPKIVFMGEKDYQQFFLIKKLIEKRYSTKVFLCKTIRSSNKVALSTRNKLLSKSDLKICGSISKEIFNIKKLSKYRPKNIKKYLKITKQKIIKKFDIDIEYLECRNLDNLGNNIVNKPYKIFIAYYIKNIRLIDNF
ncbi:pantoate--beta-alanine ligase [Candidatus Pelagibacter bacterium]|nr:pantoate--beta-alanine ligase [Candidatus Pelagibacter bacterium]